jgi:hypothetical protein
MSDGPGIRNNVFQGNEVQADNEGKAAKELQRTSADMLPGGAAAIRMPIGPENDSAIRTNGESVGRMLRTKASIDEYPDGDSEG